jgi:hypothetical protein
VRLGHAERADRLAPDHFRQPVTLLLIGAERHDVGGDKIGVDQEARAAGTHAPHFLEHHDVEQVVEAKSAVFLGHGAAQQARLAGLEPQLARNDPVLFPLVVEGDDFFFHEAAHGVAPHLVLGREETAFDHLGSGLVV